MRYLLLAVGLLLSAPSFAQVQPGGGGMRTDATNAKAAALGNIATVATGCNDVNKFVTGTGTCATLSGAAMAPDASNATLPTAMTNLAQNGMIVGGAIQSAGTVISSAANGGFFQASAGNDETFILDTASASKNNNIYWRSNGNAKFQAGINAGNVFAIYDIVNNAASFITDASGNTTIGEPTHSTTVLGSFVLGTTASTPVHQVTAQTTAPALTSCGGGSPAITGTDTAGIVTMGTTATGCVITFNVAYVSAPYCVVSWIATPLASQSYATSNTAITLTQTSTSGNKVQYVCLAQAGG